MEIKNILDARRNFIISTLAQENFSFDVTGVAINLNKSVGEGNDNYSNNREYNNKSKMKLTANKNNFRLAENIDEILNKIQQRKDKVIMQKKIMQTKLEKIGLKMF
jgi:hypothetical protein